MSGNSASLLLQTHALVLGHHRSCGSQSVSSRARAWLQVCLLRSRGLPHTVRVLPPPPSAANSGTHFETLKYLSLMPPFKRQTGAWVSWQLLFSEAQGGATLWINHSCETRPPSILPHRKHEALRGASFLFCEDEQNKLTARGSMSVRRAFRANNPLVGPVVSFKHHGDKHHSMWWSMKRINQKCPNKGRSKWGSGSPLFLFSA